MLPEVLTSLNEVKSRLQESLLQHPEYPAFLIIDRAASQLGEVLTLLQPRPVPPAALRAEEASAAPSEPADDRAELAASSLELSGKVRETAPDASTAPSAQRSTVAPRRAPAPRSELPFFVTPRLVQGDRA